MVSRSLFTSIVLSLLLVSADRQQRAGADFLAAAAECPLEILFSISPGKTTWWPPVGHGDELSDRGAVVASNWQLLRNFNPPATFAPVDYGLDALQELHWGPIAATAKPMTLFSLNTGFEDANLGPISDGDLLSDAGRIVARNKDLMARFHPMPPLQDMGLDAVFIPYYVPTTSVCVAAGDLVLHDEGLVRRAAGQVHQRGRPAEFARIRGGQQTRCCCATSGRCRRP